MKESNGLPMSLTIIVVTAMVLSFFVITWLIVIAMQIATPGFGGGG